MTGSIPEDELLVTLPANMSFVEEIGRKRSTQSVLAL